MKTGSWAGKGQILDTAMAVAQQGPNLPYKILFSLMFNFSHLKEFKFNVTFLLSERLIMQNRLRNTDGEIRLSSAR